MAGDGCNHLGVASGHHKLAKPGRHPVVAGVRALVEGVVEGVVAFAGIGLGTGDLDGHALAVDEASPLALRFNRHGIVGKRFTIIFLVIALRSQLDRAAGDGDPLPIFVFRILASSVVRARRAQHHQLSAEMGQRDTRRIVRPLFTVSAVLHLERIAELVGGFCDIRGKRRAVVDLLHIVYIPDDLASIEIAARNLKRAIDDHKLHVGEVAASIGELPGSQVHVIGAGIRALGDGLALELNVCFAVAIIARGEGVPCHTLLGAAVLQRGAVARDGDGDLVGNWRHLKGAFFLTNIVVVEVGVRVALIRERVGHLASIGDGARHVIDSALARNEAIAANGDVIVGQRLAVVHPAIACRGQRDGAFRDFQLARNQCHSELAGHIVAVSILHHRRAADGVRIFAGVNGLRVGGIQALDRVLLAVHRELGRFQSRRRVLNAVVRVAGRGVRLDRDLILRLAIGHRQLTENHTDLVVVRLGVVLQRVIERVGASAHQRLGAGEGVSGAFTLGPARLLRKRGLPLAAVFVGQSRAVVFLLKIGGLKRHLRLGDSNGTVRDIEADVRKVDRIGIRELALQVHVGRAGIDARHAVLAGESDLCTGVQRVGRRKGVTGSRQRLPVVSAFGMIARDGHHDLFGHRVHLQDTLDFGDVVVAVGALGVFRQLVARSIHQLVCERICTAASIGLRTRDVCDKLVPGNQVVTTRNADVMVFKRVAVIGFLSRRGGSQRHGALRDGERAIDDLELHVGEVGAVVLEVLGLEVHLIGAGIGALGNLIVSGSNERDIRGGVVAVRDTRKLIALDGLLGTVVFLVAGILGNSNDHLVGNRRHLKLAGLIRDVVVGGLGAVLEHDAVLRHVAFDFADVGDGAVDHGGRDTVLAHEALSRELVLRLGGSQRGPVVSPGRRAGGHGYLSRLDGQRARGDADGELLRHVIAVQVGHLIAALIARDDITVGASIRA